MLYWIARWHLAKKQILKFCRIAKSLKQLEWKYEIKHWAYITNDVSIIN